MLARLALFAGAALWSAGAAAVPSIPADDAEVLERLPSAARDPAAQQLRQLQRSLAQQPNNLALATQVAWRHIERGRALSDPRSYGYAQAALAPWWHLAVPPAPVLVLRATIRQHDHAFASALVDLDRALQQDSDDVQAWLTRAVVLQVQGAYAEAKRSCLYVQQRASALVAATCVAGIDSLSGRAVQGYDLLRGALARASQPRASERVWALTLLGEIAARTGRAALAEQHFNLALSAGVRDEYLLGAYADFLLDQHRADAVVSLLADETRADALLLRLAIAEQRIGSPAFAAHVDELRARFTAARLRGDTAHQREEARFALECLSDPRAALELAGANWAVQREPWDARVLLASALAAGEPAAAQPALDFVAQTGLEDEHLQHLVRQLQGVRW